MKKLIILFLLLLIPSILATIINEPTVISKITEHLNLSITIENSSVTIYCDSYNYTEATVTREFINPNGIIMTINSPTYTTTSDELSDEGTYTVRCGLDNNHTEMIISEFNVRIDEDTDDKIISTGKTKWVVLIILGLVTLIIIIGILYFIFK